MSKSAEALEALKALEETMLTPDQAAPVLGCKAHSIRLQAEEDPKALGFNVIRVGTRTMIPRIPFIRFIEGS